MSKENYRLIAKKMGVTHLIGRWGILIFPKGPDGNSLRHRQRFIRLIPLDGWITDPKEIAKVMKKRNYEL